jgi:NADH:ubiquinone oxidoreductase subunit 6 (subunit J)
MLSLVLGGVAAGAALLVVVLDAPPRSAAALVGVFLAGAAVFGAIEAPFLAGVALLIGGGGVSLLLLATVLMLNLDVDERGRRRVRVGPTIALFVLAYVGAALFGVVLPAARDLAPPTPIAHAAVARAVFEDAAAPVAVASVGLAVALVSAFVLARRRP